MGYSPSTRLPVSASLLIPMDDAQSDHLKAYGVAYRVVQAGIKAEWLLNYRGGSFLLPDGEAIRRDRKSTRLNSSHTVISYAVFCLKKKKPRVPQRSRSARACRRQPS